MAKIGRSFNTVVIFCTQATVRIEKLFTALRHQIAPSPQLIASGVL